MDSGEEALHRTIFKRTAWGCLGEHELASKTWRPCAAFLMQDMHLWFNIDSLLMNLGRILAKKVTGSTLGRSLYWL